MNTKYVLSKALFVNSIRDLEYNHFQKAMLDVMAVGKLYKIDALCARFNVTWHDVFDAALGLHEQGAVHFGFIMINQFGVEQEESVYELARSEVEHLARSTRENMAA